MAWSPDGTWIATVGRDAMLRIWDAVTGREVARSAGHTLPLFGCAWSPDGRRIVTCGEDRVLNIWSAVDTASNIVMRAHPWATECIAWSPDGALVASSSGREGPVKVWEAPSGRLLRELPARAEGPSSLAWQPRGHRILTKEPDGVLRLWDAASGAQLGAMPGHTRLAGACAWSSDGSLLASSSRFDSIVRIWLADAGELRWSVRADPDRPVSTLAWCPDRPRLLVGITGERGVRVIDAAGLQGSEPAACVGTSPVMRLAFAPDGRRLLTGEEDGSVREWDSVTLNPMREIGRLGRRIVDCGWWPDGRCIFAVPAAAPPVIWDAESARELTPTWPEARIHPVAVSPLGNWTALVRAKHTLSIHSCPSLDRIWMFPSEHEIISLAWSPDDKRLAMGTTDGELFFLDLER
jgi:WD40 repeat protein